MEVAASPPDDPSGRPYRPDPTDRRLIVATQAGLPLDPMPFARLAEQLGLAEDEVIRRMARMQRAGAIRRIAAVPQHYAIGVRANGMSVWDVDDVMLPTLGPRVGALPFVSHCYRRPRVAPDWPYNLFAMVHGRSREQVHDHVRSIAALLGDASRQMEVLFSSRVLKKTGLRWAGAPDGLSGGS